MYYFQYLYYFLLIIPIFFVLVFLYLKGGKNIYFSDTKILESIFKNNAIIYKFYYLIIFFIFILFISIFTNFVKKEEFTNINENGIDIQIVLDVSYSMLADDFTPNRLEVSKDIISKFIDKLSHDRLGLVVFAGKPFSSLPLNFDYEVSKKIIKNISINIINQNNPRMQGTAIGDAIIIATDGFDDKSISREKIIILLTDGEANVGVDPNLAVKFLNENNRTKDIKIYTIGIGGEKEANFKTKDIFGREIITSVGGVNEKVLEQISQKTGGKYFRASDKETLNEVFNTISKLEKKELEREKLTINKEKNIYFIYILLVLFVLIFILKYKKNI